MALVLAALLTACGGGSSSDGPDPLREGRSIYGDVCSACHGAAGQGGKTAGNRMFKCIGAVWSAIIKNVVSRFVDDGKMQVHAVARILRVGFGHKGCRKTLAAGQTAHKGFKQPCIVGCAHRVLMGKVNLELAKPAF